MDLLFVYDLFVSYATDNKDVADFTVKKLEEKGLRCFIAPRDLHTGEEYAKEIVRGISNSIAMLLLFSKESNQSGYVLREVNSAVSRNKMIIPFRIEEFLPSEAMEFYLGPTQWLDAFPEVLDIHLDKIVRIVAGIKEEYKNKKKENIRIKEARVLSIPEYLAMGITYKQLTMKAIELDFLTEFSRMQYDESRKLKDYEEWKDIAEYPDLGCVLIENDTMIGYCDFYLIDQEAFDSLMSGGKDVSLDMIDLYELGGVFKGYIAMMAIEPDKASQKKYMLLFDWVMQKVKEWKNENIIVDEIGAEVYSPMFKKFFERFGFQLKGKNGMGGTLYQINFQDLVKNKFIFDRYFK